MGAVSLLLGWPLRAQAPSASLAKISPTGAAGLAALLSGDVPDKKGVAQAVQRQGFYAGEPLGAGDCSTCHDEIAAQWAQSAHRFASFNNPYYAASVEQFRRQRGAPASRFCAGCHDPLLLVDDTIAKTQLSRQTPAAQAGLPCLICHSIRDCQSTLGNGGYVLRADPVPPPQTEAERKQASLSAPPSAHSQRLRPALLGQPELCATCHKVGLTPEVTGAEWLRGQNDYDGWQLSMAAGQGAAAVYRPQTLTVKRCQDCHMPLETLRSGQKVRSHRFIAANSALFHLRGDTDGEQRTAEFLRDAVSVDLVVMQPAEEAGQGSKTSLGDAERSGLPRPRLASRIAVTPSQQLMVDVVLRNRRVGHRFPSGTNDSNEVWLEVTVAAAGQHSGLRDAMHLVRAQPVNEHAQPLATRDPQNLRSVIYDTSVAPADPQVVRYQLDLSELPQAKTASELVLKARLRYRKFGADYARFACAELPKTVEETTRQRCLLPPVLEVASAERTLVLHGPKPLSSEPEPQGGAVWERYLDHGLGLADGLVDQVSEATPSLLLAQALAPNRAEPELGLARLALALGRMEDVLLHTTQALQRRADHPAALWLTAQAHYRTYHWAEARPAIERAAELVPKDRNVLVLLARVRGLCGDAEGALQAADQVLKLDPESEDGHHQRLLALRDLHREAEAQAAEQRYLYYRRPVERDQALRQQFRSQEPQRAFEDVPAHVHRLRPSVLGDDAQSPELPVSRRPAH